LYLMAGGPQVREGFVMSRRLTRRRGASSNAERTRELIGEVIHAASAERETARLLELRAENYRPTLQVIDGGAGDGEPVADDPQIVRLSDVIRRVQRRGVDRNG